jgi:hypothetical protein
VSTGQANTRTAGEPSFETRDFSLACFLRCTTDASSSSKPRLNPQTGGRKPPLPLRGTPRSCYHRPQKSPAIVETNGRTFRCLPFWPGVLVQNRLGGMTHFRSRH